MRTLFKKSLAFCLVASLALTCFIGSFSVSAATHSASITVADTTITQGNTTANIIIQISSPDVGINEARLRVSSSVGNISTKVSLVKDASGASYTPEELETLDFEVAHDVADDGVTISDYNSFWLSGKTYTTAITSAFIKVTFNVSPSKKAAPYPVSIYAPSEDIKVIASSPNEDIISFDTSNVGNVVVVHTTHTFVYTPNEGDTHTYDCSSCENFDPVTEDCTDSDSDDDTLCDKCGQEVSQPAYDVLYATTRSLSVKEPWAINYFVQPYDKTVYQEQNKKLVKLALDEFDDYGIYILFDIDVPEGTEVNLDYVKANGVKYSLSNGLAKENGDGRYTVRFEDRVYTYLMNKNVYTVNFTLQGTTEVLSGMSTTTFATTIDDRIAAIDNKTLTDELTAEKTMLNDMKAFYTAVINYRGSDNYSPIADRNIPRVSNANLPALVENTLGYRFAMTRSLKVTEPWAINGFIGIYPKDTTSYKIDLDTLSDYGTIVLRESDLATGTTVTTVNDVISNPNSYVFSKSNSYNSKNMVNGSWDGRYTFTLDDQLYTYQMNDDLYVVHYYITEDGGMACSSMTTTSMYKTMEDRLKVENVPENEIALINAMQTLYESVDAYRNL